MWVFSDHYKPFKSFHYNSCRKIEFFFCFLKWYRQKRGLCVNLFRYFLQSVILNLRFKKGKGF